ncbi:MAG: CNNM domain-containing protein [Candidatus Saccharibacteria bacterium]|nr:CNNM domain-containing protein [Candidatus Saccharibacteria bacterium]
MDTPVLFLFAAALLFLSGAFSGLNIGMMMARPDDLKRKARQGDAIAARVYRYRRDGHYLIFCILLGNVGVNTAMSILLGNVTSGVVGGILATALITTFGEILPQAIFSQRGYRFVRHFFWLLDTIYVVFWPLAAPVSRLLTKWIGKEPPQLYTHQELEQILHEHAASQYSKVDYDESRIAAGALRFSQKTAGDIATPMGEVFTVPLDDEMDATLVAQVKQAGHSRIPVSDAAGQFVGVLYAKDLIGQKLPKPVSQLYRDKIHDIDARSRLDTVLSRFIQTRSHLFVVMDGDKQAGIVTLEDVIEEILNREIEDEFDAE